MPRDLALRSDPRALRVIRQWQSPTEEIRHAPDPLGQRLAVWGLALVLSGSLAATPFIPIERVVTSSEGKIVSRDSLVTFQALDPSVIRSVDVHEGQEVEAGHVLATLDPTSTTADLGQLRQQIAGLDAELARAAAEDAGQPFAPPAALKPEVAAYWAQQKALFDQRAQQYAVQLKGLDEKVATTKATLAKLAGDESRFTEREKITRQVEEMRQQLYRSGASSLVSLLQANDDRLKLLQSLDSGRSSIAAAQHGLASAQADRDAFVQGWRVALHQEIVTARNNLDTAAASLEKAARRQDLVRLVAPHPSVVLSLSKLSVGSVLKQGDELMQLAPLDAPVEADVHLLARDIGFVRVGDPVTLKVSAFNSYEHGSGKGRLAWISENAFTDESSGNGAAPPYYRARASIDRSDFHDVTPDFRLVPGMTLTADVHVGSRSAFTYILGGFFRGMGETMRGP